jgi:hypothetical protein
MTPAYRTARHPAAEPVTPPLKIFSGSSSSAGRGERSYVGTELGGQVLVLGGEEMQRTMAYR